MFAKKAARGRSVVKFGKVKANNLGSLPSPIPRHRDPFKTHSPSSAGCPAASSNPAASPSRRFGKPKASRQKPADQQVSSCTLRISKVCMGCSEIGKMGRSLKLTPVPVDLVERNAKILKPVFRGPSATPDGMDVSSQSHSAVHGLC